jgi:pectate lyase
MIAKRRMLNSCQVTVVIVFVVMLSGTGETQGQQAEPVAHSKPAMKVDMSMLPAFPGAEGYGRFSKGGRGGDIYHVTNLNDSGPGSLREGIKTVTGPRIIVFDVGGTIQLAKELRIQNVSRLTIAGQTAPGDGITLRDRPLKVYGASDIIIRYLRVRLGDESKTSDDCIDIGETSLPVKDTILDHVTATWAVDGTMDTYYITNFTMQWCLFGEALNKSTHYKDSAHAMLMSFRKTQGNVSIHHNLLFSSRDRHPSLGGGNPAQLNPKAIFDFRNNVIYNWEGPCNLGQGQFDLVNNYWRPGPSSDPAKCPIAPKAEAPNSTVGYFIGNFFEGNADWTKDNYSAMAWGVRGGKYSAEVSPEQFRLDEQPVGAADRPVTQPAEEAYLLVLDGAGASKVRDAADLRVIQGIRDRTHKLIDSQKEVGGWPELKGGPVAIDTDHDGMPDAWEKKYGLNPNDPSDGAKDNDGDGYTNVEEYLNGTSPKQFIDYTKPENNVDSLVK